MQRSLCQKQWLVEVDEQCSDGKIEGDGVSIPCGRRDNTAMHATNVFVERAPQLLSYKVLERTSTTANPRAPRTCFRKYTKCRRIFFGEHAYEPWRDRGKENKKRRATDHNLWTSLQCANGDADAFHPRKPKTSAS